MKRNGDSYFLESKNIVAQHGISGFSLGLVLSVTHFEVCGVQIPGSDNYRHFKENVLKVLAPFLSGNMILWHWILLQLLNTQIGWCMFKPERYLFSAMLYLLFQHKDTEGSNKLDLCVQ